MFQIIDQLTEEYHFTLNTTPYLTGRCKYWGLGEGVFIHEDEDPTLISVDKDGNYRCFNTHSMDLPHYR